MADEIPTPGKTVYLFFEFVALGFVLEAIADIVHYGGPWYRWCGSLVIAALFLWIGIKGPSIKAGISRFGPIPIMAMLTLAILVAVGYDLYDRHYGFSSLSVPEDPPTVPIAFARAYRVNKKQLGNPSTGIIDAGESAYHVSHERAAVVWLASDSTYYALPSSAQQKITVDYDAVWQKQGHWADDAYIRKQLNLPPTQKPPWMGLAYHWAQDPKRWSWIGGRNWDCVAIKPTGIYYQRFDNGIMIGPLFMVDPFDPNRPESEKNILNIDIIFTKEERWGFYQFQSALLRPKCIQGSHPTEGK